MIAQSRRFISVTTLVVVGALLLVLGSAAMTAQPASAQAASCWEKVYVKIRHVEFATGKTDFNSDCLTVHDNRINASDLAAPVAIYCQADGVAFWDINSISQGTKAFLVTFGFLNENPTNPNENTLLVSQGGYNLYRLTSGELQLNSSPNWEGKSYVFVFSGCDHPEQQHSTMQ